MKCYEVTKCGSKERQNCYVWQKFHDDMENIKCWVIHSAFHHENRDVLKKCLKCGYYRAMNHQDSIQSTLDADIGLITCLGILNNDRSRTLSDIWDRLKAAGKHSVIVDLSGVTNIYSCGLGMVVKIHKEAEDKGGTAVFVGVQGYPLAIFDSTRLRRLVHLADDHRKAVDLIESLHPKAAPAPAPAAQTEELPAPAASRVRPSCWEYWNNRNPRNATTCEECFRKINPTPNPCWVVDGTIEGVAFQYVNEDCLACQYFLEFGTGPAIGKSQDSPEELIREGTAEPEIPAAKGISPSSPT